MEWTNTHAVLAGKELGPGLPPYVIAEVGANHNGDMGLCRRLIDEAKSSGADAVKFQSWTDKSLIARSEYERNTSYSDKKKHFGSLEEMVKAYQLTEEMHFQAAEYCSRVGITFCSSAFSDAEVDLLDRIGVPFHKVASMDINNLDLIAKMAASGKPVLLSTGMSTLGEIERAVEYLLSCGNARILLLHCVSIYPPRPEIVRLRNIPMLRDTFALPVGFSDHTFGVACAIGATSLGACCIEKHFTLDKEMAGWDHAISADPSEMRLLVDGTAEVALSLGDARRIVSPDEIEKAKKFRRSIVVTRDLPAGHVLTREDLAFKRPGTGIAPDLVDFVVGRTLRRNLGEDDLLSWEEF